MWGGGEYKCRVVRMHSNLRDHQFKIIIQGTSLVMQWSRIYLPSRGHGFDPWFRKIPHATEQLSLCAPTAKPTCPRACALQLLSPRAATTEARAPRARALQREATVMRSPRTTMKSSPCSPQLEKARVQQRRPNAAKNK